MKKTKTVSYSKKVVVEDDNKRIVKCNKKKQSNKFQRFIIKRVSFTLILLLLAFIVVYLTFIFDSPLVAGVNLEKRDWLGFVGGFLSFAATMTLSTITISQTHFYENMDSIRRIEEREREIKPVFSFENRKTSKDNCRSTVTIENVGKYPIKNVCINGKFYWHLMPVDKKMDINFSSDEWNEIYNNSAEIIINFENVDETESYQIFVLKKTCGGEFFDIVDKDWVIRQKNKGEIAQ